MGNYRQVWNIITVYLQCNYGKWWRNLKCYQSWCYDSISRKPNLCAIVHWSNQDAMFLFIGYCFQERRICIQNILWPFWDQGCSFNHPEFSRHSVVSEARKNRPRGAFMLEDLLNHEGDKSLVLMCSFFPFPVCWHLVSFCTFQRQLMKQK